VLFQNQWDFNYLEDRLLTEATVGNGRLSLGESSYSVLVRMANHTLIEQEEKVVESFAQSGGCIIRFDPTEDETDFIKRLEESLVPDVVLEPAHSDLRYIHIRKGGREFYYLTNEEGNSVEGRLTVRSVGRAEWWDPLTGESNPAVVLEGNEDSICVTLRLERREGRVLAINLQNTPVLQPDWQPPRMLQTLDISDGWKLCNAETGEVLSEKLIDWTKLEGYDRFSGTLVYEKELNVTPQMLDNGTWRLDLGKVYDFAEVFCNDISCGVRLWVPFRFPAFSSVGLALKPGINRLRVAITNSMANRMGGESLPSGMLGPVALRGLSHK